MLSHDLLDRIPLATEAVLRNRRVHVRYLEGNLIVYNTVSLKIPVAKFDKPNDKWWRPCEETLQVLGIPLQGMLAFIKRFATGLELKYLLLLLPLPLQALLIGNLAFSHD